MTKKYLRAVHTRFSRRKAVQALGALVGASALGCGDDGTASSSAGTGGDASSGGPGGSSSAGEPDPTTGGTTSGGTGGATTGDATTGDGGSTSSSGDATTGEPVDECAAGGDLTPEQLLADVEHIVVLMMENRSFDHYLGSLKFLEGKAVDGLDGDETNPSLNGDVVVYKSDDWHPKDPPHEWDPCHTQFNLGDNNGFVFENEKKNPGFGPQVMGYHVRDQLPVTYGLADSFALCERWYASVMGPTWPNRFYMHACNSGGVKSNLPSPFIKTLWHACDDAGVTSRIYFTDVPWVAGAFPLIPTVWGKLADDFGGFSLNALVNPNNLERFFDDCAAGDLAQFTIIDPGFSSNDDHPEHDPQLGQILIGTIYKALAESPAWDKTLLIVTYDEHGGFYDHVAPPTTIDEDPEFQQLGFRVPTLVIGPRVRRGCIIDTQFEHCSIGATLMRRFKVAPLNERMAKANDVSSCINPELVGQPAPAPPPIPLIDVSIKAITARVGRATSQKELFELTGVQLDEAHRQEQVDTTLRLLARAEKLRVARLRA